MFPEPMLDDREWEPRCSRRDDRFSLSPRLDAFDAVDALDELRKREKRFVCEWVSFVKWGL